MSKVYIYINTIFIECDGCVQSNDNRLKYPINLPSKYIVSSTCNLVSLLYPHVRAFYVSYRSIILPEKQDETALHEFTCMFNQTTTKLLGMLQFQNNLNYIFTHSNSIKSICTA